MLMGQSHKYYVEILLWMYKEYENRNFQWSEVIEKHPNVDKSLLSKFRANQMIIKNGYCNKKSQKYVMWKLNPNIKDYLSRKKLI